MKPEWQVSEAVARARETLTRFPSLLANLPHPAPYLQPGAANRRTYLIWILEHARGERKLEAAEEIARAVKSLSPPVSGQEGFSREHISPPSPGNKPLSKAREDPPG